MSKQTVRNALVVVGAWSLSGILALLITVLLGPLNRRLIFSGDSGAVIMWAWFGFPQALTAAVAAITVASLIETRRPLPWTGGLTALYLYSGLLNAFRTRSGFRSSPSTPDYIGIAIQGLMPAVACAIAGIWIARRRIRTHSQRDVEASDPRSESN